MPRRVVLPEIIPVRQPSEAELAAAARAASAMQAARRLADWFGDVPADRATGWEAPAARSRAAAALGLVAPGGPVTPEADQALRWAYEVAYHARYLDTDDDRQLIQRSAELSGHQERDDDDILHDWFHALDALYAHGVEEALPAGAEPGPLDFHGIGGHPLFTLLEHHGTATVEAVSAAIADGATENLAPSRSRSEWNRWMARHGDPVERYLRLAAGLGAVAVSRSQVTLTPLATWALLKELNARTEQLPPSAELTARQVIVCRPALPAGISPPSWTAGWRYEIRRMRWRRCWLRRPVPRTSPTGGPPCRSPAASTATPNTPGVPRVDSRDPALRHRGAEPARGAGLSAGPASRSRTA